MSSYRFGKAALELSRQVMLGVSESLQELLPLSWIKEGLRASGHRFRASIFSPELMTWSFIRQVMDEDGSCRKALIRIQAQLGLKDAPPISSSTGGYCRARRRLPTKLFWNLLHRTGNNLDSAARPEDLWFGHRVVLIDGSGCSMPDTQANQERFPQPSGQKPGCGFPVVKFLGVISMATGASIDLEIGNLHTNDVTLLRRLKRRPLKPGDIVLADRAFSAYSDLFDLRREGIHFVIRSSRPADFRRGKRLGKDDHIIEWNKPKYCPPALSKEQYASLPDTLELREIKFQITPRGRSARTVVLVTSLLDHKTYPAQELASLYHRRWEIETNFGHLKTTMKMDMLRGQTPEMVEKELLVHLIAYNLIRTIMWRSVRPDAATNPARLSFKAALQLVQVSVGRQEQLLLLQTIVAKQIVPLRSERREPRVIKRRRKQYGQMTRPRPILKQTQEHDRRKW